MVTQGATYTYVRVIVVDEHAGCVLATADVEAVLGVDAAFAFGGGLPGCLD